MSESLYAIGEELESVLSSFSACFDPQTGEVTDPDAFAVASAKMEALQASFADKAEAVAAWIDKQSALAAALKAREEAIAERRRAMENSADRMKVYLKSMLEKTGVKKVEGPLFRISLAKAPAAVQVLDETQIPLGYFIQQDPKLDKRALRDALKAGVEVPGAKLLTGGTSLRIK